MQPHRRREGYRGRRVLQFSSIAVSKLHTLGFKDTRPDPDQDLIMDMRIELKGFL